MAFWGPSEVQQKWSLHASLLPPSPLSPEDPATFLARSRAKMAAGSERPKGLAP